MLKPYLKKNRIEIGCDEAGRGCLAGPVFAAAVILPKDYKHPLLNDSKKVSEKNRIILRADIERNALAFAVASYNNTEIDQVNILNASIFSMHRAMDKIPITFNHILVDGNKFKPYKDIPFSCIIKGDGKFLSIAAASILAKTYRDDFMKKIHSEHPEYNWKRNKGYPTKEHRDALVKHGITPHHRKSFNLCKQLKIIF